MLTEKYLASKSLFRVLIYPARILNAKQVYKETLLTKISLVE